MSYRKVIIWRCDRCWAETENREGWMALVMDGKYIADYCDDCKEKISVQRTDPAHGNMVHPAHDHDMENGETR